jgi:hypothetical protein
MLQLPASAQDQNIAQPSRSLANATERSRMCPSPRSGKRPHLLVAVQLCGQIGVDDRVGRPVPRRQDVHVHVHAHWDAGRHRFLHSRPHQQWALGSCCRITVIRAFGAERRHGVAPPLSTHAHDCASNVSPLAMPRSATRFGRQSLTHGRILCEHASAVGSVCEMALDSATDKECRSADSPPTT